MGVTATADPANEPPRVALVGTTTGPSVAVVRTNPDGTEHPVRFHSPMVHSGGTWLGYDYEVPFGVPVTYEATSVGEFDNLTPHGRFRSVQVSGIPTGWTINGAFPIDTVAGGTGTLMRLAPTAGGGASVSALVPAVPGDSLTVVAGLSSVPSGASVLLGVNEHNAAGAWIGARWTPITITGSLVRYTALPTVVTAGTTHVGLAVHVNGAATVHVDDFLAYRTASAGESTSVSAPVTVTPDRAWLLYPGLPTASRRIRIQAAGEVTRPVDRGVFRPQGRKDAVVVSDRRRSAESSLTLYTATLAERDALLALLELGAVLLLNVPPGLGYDLPWSYISAGDVGEARPVRMLTDPARFTTVPYVVTSRPVGLETQQYTWGDVLAEQPAWRDVKSSFSSWTAVVTNVEYG